eukprot:2787498-Alexandrium_andersonii.AAC.1
MSSTQIPSTLSNLIARFVCQFTIRPPSTPKYTSLPALVRVLAARRGLFTAATWKPIRHLCCSLVKKPTSTSPQ